MTRTRDLLRVERPKPLNNDPAGFDLVTSPDLAPRQPTGHRDRSIEEVRVRRAEDRNRLASLRKRGRIDRVGVDDAANRPEGL